MANLIGEPGFETVVGWTFSTAATQSSTSPHSGTYSCRIDTAVEIDGNCNRAISGLIVGQEHTVTGWLRAPSNPTIGRFRTDINYGAGYVEIGSIPSNTLTPTWTEYTLATFTPTATSGTIRFTALFGPFGAGYCYIDDLELPSVGAALAIKLTERAIDAVIAQLQADLPTVITAINTDRGDITLATPGNGFYYNHAKSELLGSPVHVEVFATSHTIDQIYTDIGHAKVTSTCPVTVRVTVNNTEGESGDVFRDRIFRYVVGIVSVFKDDPTLSGSDTNIKIAAPVGEIRYFSDQEVESDSSRRLQAEIPIVVDMEETDS